MAIQLRRGTVAEWALYDPVLQMGEPGFATDTRELKIGDGVSKWESLEPVQLDAALVTAVVGAEVSAQIDPKISLAEEARAGAQAAQAAAEAVPTTNDGITAGLIGTPASATAAALNATYGLSLSVKEKGAVGNGITDDTAAIQSAINSVSALGGGEVWFPAGTYKTTSTLNVTSSGVTLAGSKGTVVQPALPVGGTGIRAYGTKQVATTAVTAKAAAGERTLTVAGVLAVGNVLVVRSATESFNNDRDVYKKGEMAVVASVSGSTVTLETPLRDSYDPALGDLSVDVLTMIKDFTIRDLTIRMGGTGLAQIGVEGKYVRGLRYEGMRVFKAARQGITADTCLDVAVIGTHSEGADEPGMAYGIMLGGCSNVTITGNTGRRNRHSIEVTANSPQPMSRDITITGNAVTADLSAGISTHGGTENVLIANNAVSMCGGGIVSRGAYTTVSDNTVVTAPNGSSESYIIPLMFGDDGAHPWGSGRAGDHLIVSNNRLIYVSGGDPAPIPALKVTAPLINSVIEGNVLSGFTAHGIHLQGNWNDGIQITGNLFEGAGQPPGVAGRYGILIAPRTPSATSWTKSLTVQGNQFLALSYGAMQIISSTASAAPSNGIRFLNNYVESPTYGVVLATGGSFADVAFMGNIFATALSDTAMLAVFGTLNNAVVKLNNSLGGAAPANTWAARQTFAASPALANNIPLVGLDTSGNSSELVQLSSAGVMYFGPSGPLPTVFRTGSGGTLRLRSGSADSIVVGTNTVGFYGASPVAKQTGVAVTPEAIHAALVSLGLIAA
ncbi:right-handed parallel beta-helix repeat-containing protein [Pseudarthrobacter sp. P1]|uniref:hyaluronate lyase N-terminal domain-containing protein n=1 Tax=Pseudarthrobacter sp. P1 TaxID=3418418 RepID=UPI003CECD052